MFAPPQFLEGEDAAAFDELRARVCAAVKPVDIIEEMFIADVVSLQWEVLRWRRLTWSLIRARQLEALQGFLAGQLDDDLYSEHLVDHLAEFLQDKLPKDQAHSAQGLAEKYARNEASAVGRVNEILAGIGLNVDPLLANARASKAEELVQEYVRGEPDAVTLIDDLLTRAGVNMDALTADALAEQFDPIEQIERQTTIAESRRNASLREIERHRAVLGAALRQSVQAIENDEFKVIDTRPAKGKNAA
jgi:hypothetical protein